MESTESTDSIAKQIIWFQHMHKVAGTSIVGLAKLNRVQLYKPNLNGNPQYRRQEPGATETWSEYQTTEIRYDRFSKSRLQSFIDICIDSGVQFIGSEWGFPKEPLADARIFYVTCLRDPWARFVSNFSYDQGEFPELYPDIMSWLASPKPQFGFTRNNYYTFILAGLNYQHKGPITEEHFKLALANLRKFQLVLMLEDTRCFQLLEAVLGWHFDQCQPRNATKKKLDVSWYRDQFYIDNIYDYRLYEEAKWLFKTRSISYRRIWRHEWHATLIKVKPPNQRQYACQLAHQLDKENKKEQAVRLHLFCLTRTNSAVLKRFDPQLVKLCKPCNEVEIINIKDASEYVIEILHHLSYLCYYTKYQVLGKHVCEILIRTTVPHPHRAHVEKTLKFY